ncbi:MAG TPA: hypothetical protein VGK89_01160 [Candidatus Eisenbacteria bacterium]
MRDVQMPFLSMVVFMVKWALAAIPAMLVLFVVAVSLGLVAFAILAPLSTVLDRLRGPAAVAPRTPSAPTVRGRSAYLDSLIRWDSLQKARESARPRTQR